MRTPHRKSTFGQPPGSNLLAVRQQWKTHALLGSVWKHLSGCQRALTLTPLNAYRMNLYFCPWLPLLTAVAEWADSHSHAPKSNERPVQSSGGYHNSTSKKARVLRRPHTNDHIVYEYIFEQKRSVLAHVLVIGSLQLLLWIISMEG